MPFTHALSPIRPLPVSLASLLLLSVALLGCGAEAERSAPNTTDTTPVRIDTATARTAPLPLRTSGRLASKAEIRLAFKVGGIIQQIRVDEGARVQQGETLARLDLSEIDAQVQEAESALAKAKRDLKRTRRLYRDSVATLEERQNAKTAVETAEARLQTARFNRRHAVIKAPESGRILRRHADEGEQVASGAPVFTLGSTQRGWVVRAGLPATDIVDVTLGDSAHVVFDAHPDVTIDARVSEIADAATPRTGTYQVELSIAEADVALKSGFIGRVTLYPSGTASYTEVPVRALVSGDGQQGTVFAVNSASQTVQRRSVTVARVLDSTIVLDGGLSPGTAVVTAGGDGLSGGEKIRRLED